MASTAQLAPIVRAKPKIITGKNIAGFFDILTLALSLSLFVVACIAPAAEEVGLLKGSPMRDGFYFLLWGWVGPFLVGTCAWYANPLLAGAWFCVVVALAMNFINIPGLSPLFTMMCKWGTLGCRAMAAFYGIFAFWLGWAAFSIIPKEVSPALGGNGHAVYLEVRSWEIGVYLWLSSMAVVAAITTIVVVVQVLGSTLGRSSHSRT